MCDHEPFDDTCDRCGCCGTYWVDCWNCGGDGGFNWEELQLQDPIFYSPGDFRQCAHCGGDGGRFQCLGDCDENGKHSQTWTS